MMAAPACIDVAPLEAILARHPAREASLIPILQDVNLKGPIMNIIAMRR